MGQKLKHISDEQRIQKLENQIYARSEHVVLSPTSDSNVTRLGNLLDFGQLFRAFGNN